jgi:hypothetical protein
LEEPPEAVESFDEFFDESREPAEYVDNGETASNAGTSNGADYSEEYKDDGGVSDDDKEEGGSSSGGSGSVSDSCYTSPSGKLIVAILLTYRQPRNTVCVDHMAHLDQDPVPD